jgi:hypothetical protein
VRMRCASLNAIVVALSLLAGCASLNGHGLVPGKSVPADVQALMGPPAERVERDSGESLWYYPRQPSGLQCFVVRFSREGVLLDIEQRLTERNLAKLVPDATTAREARELLGPPWRSAHNFLKDRDVWDYRMYNAAQLEYNLHVQFSSDGLLREVVFIEDRKVSGAPRGRR